MFLPVASKPDFKLLEEETLKFWKERAIFPKTLEARQGAKPCVFFAAPPTAHTKPALAHVVTHVYQDLFLRYKTMTGHLVLRRGGWNTHGLPVELEVEKKLGLTSKKQIEEYGLARFNAKCRQTAFDYIQEWERLTDRIAFWVDLQDAYVTFTRDYTESVWWILRQLWDKGLLGQGFKVVPYCPRCETPLSEHEAARGYVENTPIPSVYVRFPLAGEADTAFLVWTTAPWTLPANVALAVHPEGTYIRVRRPVDETGLEEYLILARDRVDQVLGGTPFDVVETLPGSKLRGRHYQPLFTFLPPDRETHYVVGSDFVSLTEGTGIAHLAPAFGAADLQVASDYDLPVLMTVNSEGQFVDAVTPWRNKFFKDADPLVTRDLEDRGLLFGASTTHQACPFCPYCHAPLMHSARGAWYIETTRLQGRLADLNQSIHWHPEHFKAGRFGSWLARSPDWALGRERYWGTPLPIWVCDRCGQQHCVGSVQQLADLTHQDQSQLDPHRPDVDEITFACPDCKDGTMYRVPDVLDVEFDAGSMAVAQWHYPFENQEKFGEQFPADFVCESADQTHGWLYALHAVSGLLCDRVGYRSALCLGPLLDAEGHPTTRAPGNVVDPWEALDAHGADALRWYLYTVAPPEQEHRFAVDKAGEAARSLVTTLWNTYAFFVAYASLDRWKPVAHGLWGPAEGETILDRWILSELHTLVRSVSAAYEHYDVSGATRPISQFVDDLSRWYLRRSRRRFWKSTASADKHAAYTTLHTCLTTLAKLLAPAMPFLAEALYRNLVLGADPAQPESVHLADWPECDPLRIDEKLNAEMQLITKLVSLGHGARHKASRKVRQPLAEAAFAVRSPEEARLVTDCAELIADELNVKSVRVLESASEVSVHVLTPKAKELDQKHGAHYPKVRAALLRLDPEATAQALLAGEPIVLEVDGQTVEVLPDEMEVHLHPKEGLAIMSEGGYLAALKTTLTPDLVRESLAREFVRHVQELRKTAGFDLADHIRTYYAASPLLAKAILAHADHILAETQSVELVSGAAPEGAAVAEEAFEGEKVKLGIVKT